MLLLVGEDHYSECHINVHPNTHTIFVEVPPARFLKSMNDNSCIRQVLANQNVNIINVDLRSMSAIDEKLPLMCVQMILECESTAACKELYSSSGLFLQCVNSTHLLLTNPDSWLNKSKLFKDINREIALEMLQIVQSRRFLAFLEVVMGKSGDMHGMLSVKQMETAYNHFALGLNDLYTYMQYLKKNPSGYCTAYVGFEHANHLYDVMKKFGEDVQKII